MTNVCLKERQIFQKVPISVETWRLVGLVEEVNVRMHIFRMRTLAGHLLAPALLHPLDSLLSRLAQKLTEALPVHPAITML